MAARSPSCAATATTSSVAGYLCPKGTAIKQLETDPDRVRVPMIREGETWQEVSWSEAFAEIERRLGEIRAAHGNDAVAAYLGNPNAHNLGPVLYNRVLLQALGSRNVYSASTVDQMPKQVSAGLMFGAALTIPVPDVDRTDYLLDARREPVRVERQSADGARPSRRGCARSERVAVVSSSSTRAGRRPPRKPTNTSRSGPEPTRCSSSRSPTCCSPRIWSTSVRSPTT